MKELQQKKEMDAMNEAALNAIRGTKRPAPIEIQPEQRKKEFDAVAVVPTVSIVICMNDKCDHNC